MKKLVVNAYTKDEAKAQVVNEFEIMKDATTAYKLAGFPQEAELTEFCNNYLAKNTKMIPGVGCIITIVPGVSDTRDNPYSVKDIKNEKGKRVYKKCFQIIDRDTNQLLSKCFGTKSEAKDVVKEMYREGYKGEILCIYAKEVIEGEVKAFEASYAPSKSTVCGKYICFGMPKES